MPLAKSFGIEGRHAGQGQDFAVARIEHHRRPVVAGDAEALLGRPLHVGVDGQLDALAFARLVAPQHLDLAADAVDGDDAGAVLPHQQIVVGGLDAGLADQRPRLDALERRLFQLLRGDLANVAEQVRGEVVRISAGRDALEQHVAQLVLARRHRGKLRHGGVRDHADRLIPRQRPAAIDDVADVALLDAGHRGEQPHRAIEVLRLLAHQRDVLRLAVLDQHLAVTIEQRPARRPQRNLAGVVVLGFLEELVVLQDLDGPEGHDQHEEQHAEPDLHHGQARVQLGAIVRNDHRCISDRGGGRMFSSPAAAGGA